MYPEIAQRASLFLLLHRIDADLAASTRASGCPHCGGPLHTASYVRKPRGEPPGLPDRCLVRLSLCCGRPGCRRRTLPPSCLFLGRKVYWSCVVVVVAALRQRRPQSPSINGLRRLLGVSRQTVLRWMDFFAEQFPSSRPWRSLRGQVPATVRDDDLPAGLLDLLGATRTFGVALMACLRLLAGTHAGRGMIASTQKMGRSQL